MSVFVAWLLVFAFAALAVRRSRLVDRKLDEHTAYVRLHRAEGLHEEGWSRRQALLDEAMRINHAPFWRWSP